jgi:hypothetical protein
LSYALGQQKLGSGCVCRISIFYMLNKSSIITVKNVLHVLWGLFQYDATIHGGHGCGGEYENQVGFGWTNGVIMELLHKYGDRLTARDEFSRPEFQQNYKFQSRTNIASSPLFSTLGVILALILVVVATLAAGGIG